MNAELPGEDIRLFSEAEYEFDVIKLNRGVTYGTVIQRLKQIEEFIQNYDEYVQYKDNAIINNLRIYPKPLYMALFYQKEVDLLNKNGELIGVLNRTKELLKDYINSIWTMDEAIFKNKNRTRNYKTNKRVVVKSKKEQSTLDDADKILAQMTRARRSLIKEFRNATKSGKFSKNKCPLCGTDFENIDLAITETEQFIKIFIQTA